MSPANEKPQRFQNAISMTDGFEKANATVNECAGE
jgi:hypothetical protein